MAVADADMDTDDIPTSYVLFHSANFLLMTVPYAGANDCGAVLIGAYSKDYSGCPNYWSKFLSAFEAVVDIGTKPDMTISFGVPFIHDSKIDITRRGLEFGVPFEYMRSCYRAGEPACGTYDSCVFCLQVLQNLGKRDLIPHARRPDYVDGDTDPDAA